MHYLRIIKLVNIIILFFTMMLMLSVSYEEMSFLNIFYTGNFLFFPIIIGFSSIAYGIYTMVLSFTKGD
jgi:hypothetical protein